MPPVPSGVRGRLWLAAVALLPLAACSDSTAPADDDPVATHDLLVESRVHGFAELFVVPLEGGAPVQLFAGEVNGRHATASPDGRRVAYWDMRDDEIWVVDLASGARTNVSRFEFEIDIEPAWSPDGTRLVFTSFRSGGSDIYVVNADGTGLAPLTPDDPPIVTYDDTPAWSPDGARIAFSSDMHGGQSIYTMRADGGDLVRVTADADARDREPSWSPDGKRIVFRRDRAVGAALDVDLAIVNADGSDLVELRQPGRESWPAWSPDGAWIAFASDRVSGERRVFTIRPDGREVVERAGGAAFGRHVSHPRWIRRR